MKKLTQTWKQQKVSKLRDSSFTTASSKTQLVPSQDGGKISQGSTGSHGATSAAPTPSASGGSRKRLGQHIPRQAVPVSVPKPVHGGAEGEKREKENEEDLAKKRKVGGAIGDQSKRRSPRLQKGRDHARSPRPVELNHSFQSSFGGDFDFDDDVLLAVEKAEADFNKIQEDAVPLQEKTQPKQSCEPTGSRTVLGVQGEISSKKEVFSGHSAKSLGTSSGFVINCTAVGENTCKSAVRRNSGIEKAGEIVNKQERTKAKNLTKIDDRKCSPCHAVDVRSDPDRKGEVSLPKQVQYTAIIATDARRDSDIPQKSNVSPSDLSHMPKICQLNKNSTKKGNKHAPSNQPLREATTKTSFKTAGNSSSAHSPVKVKGNISRQGLSDEVRHSGEGLTLKGSTSTFLDSILVADAEVPDGQKEAVVFCEDSQDQDNDIPWSKTGAMSGKHQDPVKFPHSVKPHQASSLGRGFTPGKSIRTGQKASKKNPQGYATRRSSTSPTNTATTPKPINRSTHKRSPPLTPISPPPSTSPARDQLLLSSWGLPDVVLQQYHRAGITKMFPWQVECLGAGRVLEGGNLVYAAPTSAGKTLVAELLVLKKILETKKKALIILPFVSVTREKMFYLQSMFSEAGVRVDGFMGSHSPPGGLASTDIAICTIEKANSLINRLLEEKTIGQLGIVVVDELHMIGDSHRGYLLELLLTKIRYVTATTLKSPGDVSPSLSNPIQIVGMSATLPNLDLLARWLDADLYRTDFRPVPLTEHVKIGKAVFDSSMSKVREVKPPFEVKVDEDQVFSLCLETISKGNGVLVFCPTKNWCEKLCEMMAREIYNMHQGQVTTNQTGFVKASNMLPLKLDHASLRDVVEQLRRTPVSINSVLRKTIPCGVGYHHAGLTFDERDIIEGAFRHGFLKILVATSTLSSGVNLPARRVIIRSIMFNRKVIDPLTYKQMIGRAGRKGIDTEGESILVCKTTERDKASKLMRAELPPVQSCLIKSQGDDLSNSLKRAILEIIASGVASSPTEVQAYASSTLLAASLSEVKTDDQGSGVNTGSAVLSCVKFLEENEFIRLQNVECEGETTEKYCPTQLGKATLSSALSPGEALQVFAELQKARKNFVLENELHILYQVTPIYNQGFQPDWYQFVCTWEKMSSDQRRVAELVGVEESFLMRASQGLVSSASRSANVQKSIAIHRRFYTTLILHELVNEVPLPTVAAKYSCGFGQLQSLQQSASTFSGMVTVFCSRLGWWNLELLLAQFKNRLNFGIQRELCDLVRISLLNAQRARLLYDAGYPTVAAVATCNPDDVETLLRNSVPFKSGRQAHGEDAYEAVERKQTRCIWATGRKGLTEAEAAKLIVSEARQIVQVELGVADVAWGKEEEKDDTKADNVGQKMVAKDNTKADNGGQKTVANDDGPREGARDGDKGPEAGLEHVSEGSDRSGNIMISCNGNPIPEKHLEKELILVKGRDQVAPEESPAVDEPIPNRPSTSSKSVEIHGNSFSNFNVRHPVLKEVVTKPSDSSGEKFDDVQRDTKAEAESCSTKGVANETSGSECSSTRFSGRKNSFKHPSVLRSTDAKDSSKKEMVVTVQVHAKPQNRKIDAEQMFPQVPSKQPKIITNKNKNEIARKESTLEKKDIPVHFASSSTKEKSHEIKEQEEMAKGKITSTPITAEDKETHHQGREKETSPELFSCPLDEGGLEEALQQMVEEFASPARGPGDGQLLECSSPGRGPGDGQVLQDKGSHSRDGDGMLVGEEDGISPTFPSMDSQLEQYMAEYCTQNDIVAESASPDLDAGKKSGREHLRNSQDIRTDDKLPSGPSTRETALAINTVDGTTVTSHSSSAPTDTVAPDQAIDADAEETVQNPDSDSHPLVETTQDVLLAADMCELFDSFSCSIQASVTSETNPSKAIPPLIHTDQVLSHSGERGTRLTAGSPENYEKDVKLVNAPSAAAKSPTATVTETTTYMMQRGTDKSEAQGCQTDDAMQISSDESFSYLETPDDNEILDSDPQNATMIFVGKSKQSCTKSCTKECTKHPDVVRSNAKGATLYPKVKLSTRKENTAHKGTAKQIIGKQSFVGIQKPSKSVECSNGIVSGTSGNRQAEFHQLASSKGHHKVSVSSKTVSKKASLAPLASNKPSKCESSSRTVADDVLFSPERENTVHRNAGSLLSPGTMAMLDLFAGEDDDMFTQLKETPKSKTKDKTVLAGKDMNVSKIDTKGVSKVSGGRDVKQNKSQIKDKGAIPSRKDSAIALSREHPKRKNEQKDSGSPPKRQRTPPKAYPAVQEESGSAIAKGPAGVVFSSDSEHPERRTSDTGDYIPPTPPRTRQTTPRISKASGTQKPKSKTGQTQQSGKKKKTQEKSQQISKRTSPRALTRSRQNLEAVMEERHAITKDAPDGFRDTKDKGLPKTNTKLHRTSPVESNQLPPDRTAGQTIDVPRIPAIAMTPSFDSEMLCQDSEDLFSPKPIESQDALNMGMDEFDFSLKFSLDSDSEIPPSPHPVIIATTSRQQQNHHQQQSLMSSFTPSFSFPQSFSCSPAVPSSDNAFTIVDVCANVDLFSTFLSEWKRKTRYAVAVACEKYHPPVQGATIGGNFKKPGTSTRKEVQSKPDGFPIENLELLVTGIAVCWGGKDAYFVSLQKEITEGNADDTLAPPDNAPNLSVSDRLSKIRPVLEIEKLGRTAKAKYHRKVVFGAKHQYKILSQACGCLLAGSLEDPKIAQWLIDPGSKEPNLQSLVTQYTPTDAYLLEALGGGIGLGGPGVSPETNGSSRLRATTEAVLSLQVMDTMQKQLEEMDLWQPFTDVEMPSIVTLARVELNGIGIDGAECETQKAVMQAKLKCLEEEAYKIAGHGFSLTSPDDVAQVLYTELKLPPNGDPSSLSTSAAAPARRTLGARGRPRLSKHFSTSKDALEKLKPLHPLPALILEFRRISAAVAKVVFPLQKEKVHNGRLDMDRVFTVYQTHTATGRVATFEPNIQAIPKEFDIDMPSVIGESPPGGGAAAGTGSFAPSAVSSCRGKKGRMTRIGAYTPLTMSSGPTPKPGPKFAVCIRNVFCPFKGGLMLAADYSQLELRLLAHLAKDRCLMGILNSGSDVFKQIAAKWKHVDVDSVSAEQRQQAKQMCYGMIYGIGARALGEQLGVCEEDAAAFMESFKSQYKGMKNYLLEVVKQCREKGYVQTLTGRRRYLPAIHHTNPGARNQAERQAVNTTVQGSAADLVKTAMVKIDRRLAVEYPATKRSHKHKEEEESGTAPGRRKSRRLQTSTTGFTPPGAFLVLQLHDELIYEVRREDVDQVAQLIKTEMENAMKLSVRLPVKVKFGPTWGTLEEMDL
ncbi:DNA polymerase theta [Strongylocentrotus purpuratus]|uniref:DNA polymerase theta n=1 Tax=Strongylocentrotus purpuratus TaxID=7668 RepID=A0A7M7PEQ8_STRPU|nr:DNA polymerase theta [Strongylocentrotus purpuratus]